MDIIKYILINLLLFCSWYCLLYKKRSTLRFADRLTGTFILGLAQIIITEMLLGVLFKKLYPDPLFFLNLLISSCILFVAVRNAGTTRLLHEIRDKAAWLLEILSADKILFCIFTLFTVSVCWMVFLGYLFPSYSWDALYYHLPIVGQIMQSGAIQENSNPSFIQQYINIFPKNINLFFLWNIIFLKSDVIVDLSQLLFTLAGVITIYSMAVKLKIKEKYAIYSALLFFFTPVLILQSTINYVDVTVSMLFLIAINFLMYDNLEDHAALNAKALLPKQRRLPVLLSGVATGILLGAKPTGPYFIVAIACAILVREFIKYFTAPNTISAKKRSLLKEWLQIYLIYFIAPVILIGGYWYIRNWIFHGNPVYYVDISVFNVTIFKGLKKDWVEASPAIFNNLGYFSGLFHVWLERISYYMYDSRLGGFGPIWFILFLPGIVFSVVYSATKKKYNFLFVILMIIITYLVQPRNWASRYVMYAVGSGALSFGLLLDYFEKKGTAIKMVALLLAIYTFLTVNSPCIMPEKIREFILLPANERTLSRHKPFNLDIKVRDVYGYWTWINNNVLKDDTLTYTFESFVLDPAKPVFTAPLWNREFSNNVLYLKSENYQKWLQELEKNNVTYILLKKGSIEDEWIEKERNLYYSIRWIGNITEKFKVVYADSKYEVVKFTMSLQ